MTPGNRLPYPSSLSRQESLFRERYLLQGAIKSNARTFLTLVDTRPLRGHISPFLVAPFLNPLPEGANIVYDFSPPASLIHFPWILAVSCKWSFLFFLFLISYQTVLFIFPSKACPSLFPRIWLRRRSRKRVISASPLLAVIRQFTAGFLYLLPFEPLQMTFWVAPNIKLPPSKTLSMGEFPLPPSWLFLLT